MKITEFEDEHLLMYFSQHSLTDAHNGPTRRSSRFYISSLGLLLTCIRS